MSTQLVPTSVAGLVEAVRSTPQVLAAGAGTKPRLTEVEAVKLRTSSLAGIVEYDPSEFTFTALAGTKLSDLVVALAERGQYLPFDPPLAQSGATLGGTVASGLSGPGRFRFGGLRDFILGVQFVDGRGRLLRMGGKVVKNAAGFDLPKFFVGSLGRFGILCELTFKVFPKPPSSLTLKLPIKGPAMAAERLIQAARTRWELDALDVLPGGEFICARLAGPEKGIQPIAQEILGRWPAEIQTPAEAETLWNSLREFSWAYRDGPLIKVPLTPTVLPKLGEALIRLDGSRLHVSAGGNLAFISLPTADQMERFDLALRALGLRGMNLRDGGLLWCGVAPRSQLEQAVKLALDPLNRFPPLHN